MAQTMPGIEKEAGTIADCVRESKLLEDEKGKNLSRTRLSPLAMIRESKL